MLVERRLADVGALGDIEDIDVAVALFDDHVAGGGQDRLARGGFALLVPVGHFD